MNVEAGLLVFGALLGLVVLLCWIALPFAVMGLKPLLRELIDEQIETQRLIERQTAILLKATTKSPPRLPPRPPRPDDDED